MGRCLERRRRDKADGYLRGARAIAAIRSPDDSKVKQKMLFAASKEALRRALVGIIAEIQATDMSEVAYETGVPFGSLLSPFR